MLNISNSSSQPSLQPQLGNGGFTVSIPADFLHSLPPELGSHCIAPSTHLEQPPNAEAIAPSSLSAPRCELCHQGLSLRTKVEDRWVPAGAEGKLELLSWEICPQCIVYVSSGQEGLW